MADDSPWAEAVQNTADDFTAWIERVATRARATANSMAEGTLTIGQLVRIPLYMFQLAVDGTKSAAATFSDNLAIIAEGYADDRLRTVLVRAQNDGANAVPLQCMALGDPVKGGVIPEARIRLVPPQADPGASDIIVEVDVRNVPNGIYRGNLVAVGGYGAGVRCSPVVLNLNRPPQA
jgi:hypothetical protein